VSDSTDRRMLKHLTHMHSLTILPISMDLFVERCRMLACMCTAWVIYVIQHTLLASLCILSVS
jgi:hypothetical protein